MLTGLYIGLQKFLDFKGKAKIEQIIAIVTKRTVSSQYVNEIKY